MSCCSNREKEKAPSLELQGRWEGSTDGWEGSTDGWEAVYLRQVNKLASL